MTPPLVQPGLGKRKAGRGPKGRRQVRLARVRSEQAVRDQRATSTGSPRWRAAS